MATIAGADAMVVTQLLERLRSLEGVSKVAVSTGVYGIELEMTCTEDTKVGPFRDALEGAPRICHFTFIPTS
jgi:hypothetical protein